ncbi:dehydrogenase [Paractinoplanes rishiriensis]|uniref:Dehydrogenase n=2 Tax=Paractinoplanes rishiriensis TaxID=1050105 RepID=A0A919JZ35_9ACTN|nr:dehydrogenase [Actinoplanes rishiriensis]
MDMRSGIIGTGFIGGVHAYAVRAAGGALAHVAAESLEHAAEAARRLGAEHACASAEELINADDVDVVHVCTPNALHVPQAEAAIRAGKHVICEKPLATDPADARRLVEAAADAGLVAAVPFVYRFYPSVREARARIGAGDAGPLWLLHGSYLQDWLAGSDATNWRVDPKLGGASRAFGDIGVHWCDLMEFTTGHRITRLIARMATAHPDRITEDGAAVLFGTDRGASGSVVVSQVSPGRKNRLWFEFDGPSASYAFDQELPDSLWVGGKRGNQVVPRGPDTFSGPAAGYARLPAGHPQGYQDSFTAFVADVYAAIGGHKPDGLPMFADGLRAAVLTAAVVESAADETWVEVPQ